MTHSRLMRSISSLYEGKHSMKTFMKKNVVISESFSFIMRGFKIHIISNNGSLAKEAEEDKGDNR